MVQTTARNIIDVMWHPSSYLTSVWLQYPIGISDRSDSTTFKHVTLQTDAWAVSFSPFRSLSFRFVPSNASEACKWISFLKSFKLSRFCFKLFFQCSQAANASFSSNRPLNFNILHHSHSKYVPAATQDMSTSSTTAYPHPPYLLPCENVVSWQPSGPSAGLVVQSKLSFTESTMSCGPAF